MDKKEKVQEINHLVKEAEHLLSIIKQARYLLRRMYDTQDKQLILETYDKLEKAKNKITDSIKKAAFPRPSSV